MLNLFRWAIGSALALAAPALASAGRGDVMIRNVTIVDVEHAKTMPRQAIVTRGEDIVAVGADRSIARRWRAKRTIDARGRFAIPGLWDMHVHFGGGPDLIEETKALLPLYVAHGVTTIRDASGDLSDEVLTWRRAIRNGLLLGPTLLTSGPKMRV